MIKSFRSFIREDGEVPINNVGSGNIAAIGIGPMGQPGIDLNKLKKKRKIILTKNFNRKQPS